MTDTIYLTEEYASALRGEESDEDILEEQGEKLGVVKLLNLLLDDDELDALYEDIGDEVDVENYYDESGKGRTAFRALLLDLLYGDSCEDECVEDGGSVTLTLTDFTGAITIEH